MQILFNKRKIEFEKLFLFFLLLNLFFLVFINEGQLVVEQVISVFATLFTVKMALRDKNVRRKIMLIFLTFFYLFLVTLKRYDTIYLAENLKVMYRPAILLIFLSSLQRQRPDIVKDVIVKHYVFFNVYYFFNLLMMIYQIRTEVFYDNITGFIGIYGTHRLTMFVCFLIILNLQMIPKVDVIRKSFLIVSTAFILGSSLIISSFNDNNAIYIFLPAILILYFYTSNRITLSTILKIIFVVLIVYIAIMQLLTIDEVREFFESRLFTKIDEMLMIFTEGRMEEERYVYIEFALENLSGKTIGVGIGRHKLVGDPILRGLSIELRNWGMSSMASFIAAGGVVFMFIYILIYTYIAAYPSKNKKMFPIFFILFVMLFYYGNTPTSIPMITAVWLVLYVFSRSDEQETSITIQE